MASEIITKMEYLLFRAELTNSSLISWFSDQHSLIREFLRRGTFHSRNDQSCCNFLLHLTDDRLHEQILGVRLYKLSRATHFNRNMQKSLGRVPIFLGDVPTDRRARGTQPLSSPLSTPMAKTRAVKCSSWNFSPRFRNTAIADNPTSIAEIIFNFMNFRNRYIVNCQINCH